MTAEDVCNEFHFNTLVFSWSSIEKLHASNVAGYWLWGKKHTALGVSTQLTLRKEDVWWNLCGVRGLKYLLGDGKTEYMEWVTGSFNPDTCRQTADCLQCPWKGLKLQPWGFSQSWGEITIMGVRWHSTMLPFSLQPLSKRWIQVLCTVLGIKIRKNFFSSSVLILAWGLRVSHQSDGSADRSSFSLHAFPHFCDKDC